MSSTRSACSSMGAVFLHARSDGRPCARDGVDGPYGREEEAMKKERPSGQYSMIHGWRHDQSGSMPWQFDVPRKSSRDFMTQLLMSICSSAERAALIRKRVMSVVPPSLIA